MTTPRETTSATKQTTSPKTGSVRHKKLRVLLPPKGRSTIDVKRLREAVRAVQAERESA